MNWNIKTKHQREDGGLVALELESMDKTLDVNVRWDGCMEIHIYSVTEENRSIQDTLHTCDIRGLTEIFISLNQVCEEAFGSNGYWEHTNEQEDSNSLNPGFSLH
jgi:hypothetical protein